MIIANIVALALVTIGAINWGTVGIFDFNFVSALLGTGIWTTVVYCIVLAAALWLVGYAIYARGKIDLNPAKND